MEFLYEFCQKRLETFGVCDRKAHDIFQKEFFTGGMIQRHTFILCGLCFDLCAEVPYDGFPGLDPCLLGVLGVVFRHRERLNCRPRSNHQEFGVFVGEMRPDFLGEEGHEGVEENEGRFKNGEEGLLT